ncbi:MAG: DUF1302 family protein [SAR324 cluster bacterium]|nr:DUF1302 family protein [SAR324 cluster bacterium]
MRVGWILLFVLVGLALPLHGQEQAFPDAFVEEAEVEGLDASEEADEFGFEELEPEMDSVVPETSEPDTTTLLPNQRWTLQHDVAYRPHQQRTASNRLSLRLELEQLFGEHAFLRFDGKVAYNAVYDASIYTNRNYPDSVREKFRRRRTWREGYLQLSFGKISLKLGQQVVVWGKSDASVVTDLVSPRDQTEGFSTPVDEARLGQRMLVLDLYPAANQQLTLIANPDPQVNAYAPTGHEYALAASSTLTLLPEQRPGFSGSDTEYGLRWGFTAGERDFSLLAADLVDNDFVLALEGTALRPKYRRFRMLGLGFNSGSGKFLWKGEAAVYSGKGFTTTDYSTEPDGITERDVLAGALGFDYTSAENDQITLEASNHHIRNWQAALTNTRKNTGNLLLSWSRSFLSETLTPEYALAWEPQDGDSLHQFQLRYDWSDALTFELGGFTVLAEKETTTFGRSKPLRQVQSQVRWVF